MVQQFLILEVKNAILKALIIKAYRRLLINNSFLEGTFRDMRH
jgi:hypothetical protein